MNGVDLVHQFKPCSLLNVSYKILTKVLANRLRSVLGNFVHKAQSAFIKDRFILDSVALVEGIIASHDYSHHEEILHQLDFENAYDKVDWNFLTNILRASGFSGNGLVGFILVSIQANHQFWLIRR